MILVKFRGTFTHKDNAGKVWRIRRRTKLALDLSVAEFRAKRERERRHATDNDSTNIAQGDDVVDQSPCCNAVLANHIGSPLVVIIAATMFGANRLRLPRVIDPEDQR
ncbi:hypothetical protein SMNI109538_06335 [Smaragdicoccus niigatensis]